MKILFVCPIHTTSGWGVAAREYARSLLTFTEDLKIANFYMGGGEEDGGEFQPYISKKMDEFDVLLQMALPSFLYRDNRFKVNASLFFSETILESNDSIFKRLEIIDRPFFASKNEASQFLSGNAKSQSIGIPCSAEIGNREYVDIRSHFKANEDTYTFYTIAEDNERKNLDALVKAYLTGFTNKDNVSLVIKTSSSGLKNRVAAIKQVIRDRDQGFYPPIYIINQRSSDEDIYALHQACNCFVNTSHGESWCIPAYHAMLFKNHIIYPADTGLEDFLGKTSAKKYQTILDYCNVSNPPLPYYYTGQEMWRYGNTSEIAFLMQDALRNKRSLIGGITEAANKYSYESVGRKIKTCLES